MTIAAANALRPEKFVDLLGGIYEHSPWVAEKALPNIPFLSVEQLIATLRKIVSDAPREAQRTLLLAHPDLAGRLARGGELTAHSRQEQAGLGLDRLGGDHFEELTSLNAQYRETFGIPFIICVRRLETVEDLLAEFRKRIRLGSSEEFTTALEETHRIAEFRTRDLFAS